MRHSRTRSMCGCRSSPIWSRSTRCWAAVPLKPRSPASEPLSTSRFGVYRMRPERRGEETQMKQVMFVELGMGADLHGQDVTKAAVRAVRNAIERNSMPGMRSLVDGDTGKMQVRVHLAVPADADKLDEEAVRAVFPYGQVSIHVGPGGMLAPSGIFLADKGDKNEMIYIVNAAVEVGI